MKVTQKKLDDGKLLLTAVASKDEVSRALTASHIAFAQQMGLRPEKDKTVAMVAEEKMGIKDLDSIVEPQAIEYLVPFAIDKKGLTPAYPPKPSPKMRLKRGEEFTFELEVAPKPDYELTSYDPVEITIPALELDESEVEKQLAQLAERYVEYVTDDPHPVHKGDSCLLALEAYENGEKLNGLTTDARPYTTGAGLMPDGFDEAIIGMDVGETKTFTFEGPSLDDDGNEITQTIECTATVKEIQKRVIPTINDEWVKKNMPMYKDAEALRKNIADSLAAQQKQEYEEYKRQVAAAELAKRFEGRIDDPVYEAMSQSLMNNLRMQLAQQNIKYEDFVQQQGGEQQFNMMMMMNTRQMLVQGYALDAVFRHENLVLSDEDLEDTVMSMNPQNPRGARQQMEESGRGFALREAAERMKANKWIVEHAIIHVQEPKK